MKKNLVSRLLLLLTLSVSLNSCRTDEIMTGTEQTTKEKIAFFERFEKENALAKNNSRNYAIPFSQSILSYFEKYPKKKLELEKKYGIIDLKVSSQEIGGAEGDNRKLLFFPMLKDGKVIAVIAGVINAERDYLYFDVYKDTHSDVFYLIDKFQHYYNSRFLSKNDTTEINEIIITMIRPVKLTAYDGWGGNGGPGNGGHDMGGGSGDFGGGGGGYNPYNPANPDPCEKTKGKISDAKFKAKFEELNKPEMFGMNHEKGFYERLPPPDSNLPSGFPVIDGAPCTTGLDYPENENGIAGLLHIHNDFDCEGNSSVKIFSPKDVRTFLNKLMKQSRIYTGSYTNAYSAVITSQGSYMLQYTNDTWPGSTWDKIDSWNSWYKTKYENLIENNQLTQDNVEKVFSQFLKEVVGIDGLEVYKIDKTTSKKLEYNGKDKPVKETPCPN